MIHSGAALAAAISNGKITIGKYSCNVSIELIITRILITTASDCICIYTIIYTLL